MESRGQFFDVGVSANGPVSVQMFFQPETGDPDRDPVRVAHMEDDGRITYTEIPYKPAAYRAVVSDGTAGAVREFGPGDETAVEEVAMKYAEGLVKKGNS